MQRAIRLVSLLCLALVLASGALSPVDRLEELIRELNAARTPELEIRALEQIAAIEAEETAELATAITEILGDYSRSEEPGVQQRAVELLGSAPDRDLALSELTRCSLDIRVEVDAILELLAKASGDAGESERLAGSGDTTGALFPLVEAAVQLKEARRRSADVHALRERLAQSLSKFQVDGAVIALANLLESGSCANLDAPVNVLLEFGSGPAIETLVRLIQRYEEDHRVHTATLKKLKKAKAPKKPSREVDSREWNRLFRDRMKPRIEQQEKTIAELEAWGPTLVKRMDEFANAHDLSRPPRKLIPSSRWRAWGSKAKKVLPESLESD